MGVDRIALVLVILGAINWASVGIFQYDIVANLFQGTGSIVSRVIYTVIGAAGLWCISLLMKDREKSA